MAHRWKTDNGHSTWWARCARARRERPFSLSLALVVPIPGGLALVLGDAVSRALSNVTADAVSRSMGALLLVGALFTLMGIARGKHIAEVIGLAAMSAGFAIYGLGVLLGLGLQGAVAGPITLALAVGCVLRILSLGNIPPPGQRSVP